MEKTFSLNPASPDTVDLAVLLAVPYQYAGKRDITVEIVQPEFTSVCPMTGLPDFGIITVVYCPNERIVELKSFKYYLLQYRNVGIFYEHVINRILDHLVDAVDPQWMSVTGDFTPRGGIKTVVTARHGIVPCHALPLHEKFAGKPA
ncbi:MAG: NADPH-dependent 7-cyano-7-deazaguanine reductase QueF [Deltaproteobacteria bacterium]|nr:NADPH-dependent 7-cyano-7-deazaguanine reductase QueF [Deltaproteobacteria bacterium]